MKDANFPYSQRSISMVCAIMAAFDQTVASSHRIYKVGSAMWMDKLSAGVLRVQTTIGPRYIGPSFRDRIFLLWIFRHFDNLPQQVLAGWQRRFIDRLCVEHHFITMPQQNLTDAPVIGTIERRPVVGSETLPSNRPSGAVADSANSTPISADARQRS
jgi:hypothetical protein